ncbi:predicted protein [Plenodomus lingam JN3]|uniref:Predicted protein n=1 Tax=Leptosphaeria maculans (strain JN3 / isolate v23.1.3 / race Av1-4-5-6-7-8) TaxID=985895 RepID=E5A2A3_LEPMJ|nr:predicted protein [Plenodomus lingam JN3]CBX97538.1 predicted protein [Plenodomus lingam JN3]
MWASQTRELYTTSRASLQVFTSKDVLVHGLWPLVSGEQEELAIVASLATR